MSINFILEAINSGRWLGDGTAVAVECAGVHLTDAESQRLTQLFHAKLEGCDALSAANALVAAVVVDCHRTLQRLRRQGALRPSKRCFDSPIARDVLAAVLQHSVLIGLPEPAVVYLRSLWHLHAIGTEVHSIERRLIELLQRRRHPFLKRLLAIVELVFMADIQLQQARGDRQRRPSDPLFWTREDIAEAFSYLTHLFIKSIGPPDFDCPIDDRGDIDADSCRALVMAAHVRKFLEWEALVDGLDYRCVETAPGRLSLRPPDLELERAIRLSYMLTEFSMGFSRSRRPRDGGSLSLRQAADLVNREIGDRILRHVTAPMERVRFEFPAKLFTDHGLFDLAAFLADGTIRLGEEARCFWQGKELVPDDLLAYFDGDITLEPMWRAMRHMTEEFRFGPIAVTAPSVCLDMAELAEAMGFQEMAARMREKRKEPSLPALPVITDEKFRRPEELARRTIERREQRKRRNWERLQKKRKRR